MIRTSCKTWPMSRLLTLIGIFVHWCIRRTIPLKILFWPEFTYKKRVHSIGAIFTKPTAIPKQSAVETRIFVGMITKCSTKRKATVVNQPWTGEKCPLNVRAVGVTPLASMPSRYPFQSPRKGVVCLRISWIQRTIVIVSCRNNN